MIRFDVDSIDLFRLRFVGFFWLLSKIKVNICNDCNPFHKALLLFTFAFFEGFCLYWDLDCCFRFRGGDGTLEAGFETIRFFGVLVHALAVISVCSGKEYLAASQVIYTHGRLYDTKFDLFELL